MVTRSIFNKFKFKNYRYSLCYITQKLVGPMIQAEKLGRQKFDFIPTWKKDSTKFVFEKSRAAILFHFAILREDAVKRINKCIEKAEKAGCAKIIILCFYALPTLLAQITKTSEISIYSLVKDPQMRAIKSMVLNESQQFKTPVASEYEEAVLEQLSYISQ